MKSLKDRAKFKPPLRGEESKTVSDFSLETFGQSRVNWSSFESKEDAQVCTPFINITFLHKGYRHDKQACMPLTEDEMRALRMLLREELQGQLRPFQHEVSKRFDEVASQMDGLYQRDEKREQEYLSIREQIRRLEAKFA